MFGIAKAESCQAQMLSAHFGESLSEPCGHCSACTGEGPWQIPDVSTCSVGSSAMKVINELAREYPDRFATARDRARFLCGLSSPSFVRARLTRHAKFRHLRSRPLRQRVETGWGSGGLEGLKTLGS